MRHVHLAIDTPLADKATRALEQANEQKAKAGAQAGVEVARIKEQLESERKSWERRRSIRRRYYASAAAHYPTDTAAHSSIAAALPSDSRILPSLPPSLQVRSMEKNVEAAVAAGIKEATTDMVKHHQEEVELAWERNRQLEQQIREVEAEFEAAPGS